MATADDTTAVVDLEVDWFGVCRCFCSSGCRTLDCLLLAGEGAWLWRRRCVTNWSGGMGSGSCTLLRAVVTGVGLCWERGGGVMRS